MDFPIVVASPKDEGKYAFKAIQTYDNDDKVKWTGKENSEHPAPTLEVKKNANRKDEKSKDTASEQTSSGGSIALWIVSIIAIILSLVALFKHSRK